jgi:hypothetical protein
VLKVHVIDFHPFLYHVDFLIGKDHHNNGAATFQIMTGYLYRLIGSPQAIPPHTLGYEAVVFSANLSSAGRAGAPGKNPFKSATPWRRKFLSIPIKFGRQLSITCLEMAWIRQNSY